MKKHILTLLMLLFAVIVNAQKVSILGDSYSTYANHVVPDTNLVWYPFADGRNDVKRVEDTWWRILMKDTGWTLIRNNSYSGSTICYRGYNNEDYRLRSFENRCDDLGNPDIILIFGGTNDSWSGAKVGEYKYGNWDTSITPAKEFGKGSDYASGELYTYRPALAKMLDRMKRQYAKARIYFILNSELREEINESSYAICKHYDIPVIALHDIDKQMGHPSKKGMRAIAEQVKAFVMKDAISGNNCFNFGTVENPKGHTVHVDSHGFLMDGIPVIPVMGEIHYSRVPENEWRNEIRKMRAGGITIVSTYIFWNHHEAIEGQWNWSGNRNLHRFLEICKEEQMPVVLRVGPFCHGEVWQGGFPDWIVAKAQSDSKQYKIRTTAPGFIAAVKRLYSNIYAQSYDMMWKNGGTVIGMQIENECRGPWPYYMALKDIALEIGFDLPFYTRTGWPKLNGKEEFGKLLPLYGDYADGFWDRVLTDMPGDYKKAFIMKDNRMSTVIATETFNKDELTSSSLPGEGKGWTVYPYLTCELGGGMMPAYHRRINISGHEAMPLAICKLGSGSNLPGYYMYHGGSNEYNPLHTMAETQASPVTNYNDMPLITYDFQSPLGEMGQLNETAYHETRWLHQFLADWGEELALADVDTLSDNYARRGAFEFYNDYVRILNEGGKAYVSLKDWHGITTIGIQPFAKADGKLYFIPVKGAKKYQLKVNGKTYTLKLNKAVTISNQSDGAGLVELLSYNRAKTAFVIDGKMHYAQHGGILYKGDGGAIVEECWEPTTDITVNITQDAAKNHNVALREVKMGGQKVAAMPVDSDFENAAIYTISIDGVTTTSLSGEGQGEAAFLKINYQGDVARVYADGKLVEDNFWNGKPMLVRLSDIVNKKVELRILPLGKDYPIYLQKEQRDILDKAENGKLLRLEGIEIVKKTLTPALSR